MCPPADCAPLPNRVRLSSLIKITLCGFESRTRVKELTTGSHQADGTEVRQLVGNKLDLEAVIVLQICRIMLRAAGVRVLF